MPDFSVPGAAKFESLRNPSDLLTPPTSDHDWSSAIESKEAETEDSEESELGEKKKKKKNGGKKGKKGSDSEGDGKKKKKKKEKKEKAESALSENIDDETNAKGGKKGKKGGKNTPVSDEARGMNKRNAIDFLTKACFCLVFLVFSTTTSICLSFWKHLFLLLSRLNSLHSPMSSYLSRTHE